MDLSMLKKLSRAIDKIYFPLPKKNEYIRGGAVVALPTSESKIKNVDLVYPLPHKGGVTGDRWDKPPYPERYRDKPEERTRSNLPVPKGHRPIPTGTGECGKHQYVYASVISGTDNAWVKGGKKKARHLCNMFHKEKQQYMTPQILSTPRDLAQYHLSRHALHMIMTHKE